MDLRHKFETETGNGIYSGDGQLLPSGSFKDEYVEWLEKLVKNNVDLANVSRMYVISKDYFGVTYYYIDMNHWTPLFEGAHKYYDKPDFDWAKKYGIIEYYG